MQRTCLTEGIILASKGGRVVIPALEAPRKSRSWAATGVHIVRLQDLIPLFKNTAGRRIRERGSL
jgi:hypothetical protein